MGFIFYGNVFRGRSGVEDMVRVVPAEIAFMGFAPLAYLLL